MTVIQNGTSKNGGGEENKAEVITTSDTQTVIMPDQTVMAPGQTVITPGPDTHIEMTSSPLDAAVIQVKLLRRGSTISARSNTQYKNESSTIRNLPS